MPSRIYYLPGRGGRLTAGLGEALCARGLSVVGRETIGEFRALSFSEQVDLIAQDLVRNFWDTSSLVLTNSFGSYLFLHAQAQLQPYPGRVLILSPIVGEFSNVATGTLFSPPYPKKLATLAETASFPSPRDAQIHVGSEDWQSVPENVQRFGRLTQIPVHVVEHAGHLLPKAYVTELLDEWLT